MHKRTSDPNEQGFHVVVPTPRGNTLREPTAAERTIIVGWSAAFQRRHNTLPVYDYEVPGVGRIVFDLPGPWGLAENAEH